MSPLPSTNPLRALATLLAVALLAPLATLVAASPAGATAVEPVHTTSDFTPILRWGTDDAFTGYSANPYLADPTSVGHVGVDVAADGSFTVASTYQAAPTLQGIQFPQWITPQYDAREFETRLDLEPVGPDPFIGHVDLRNGIMTLDVKVRFHVTDNKGKTGASCYLGNPAGTTLHLSSEAFSPPTDPQPYAGSRYDAATGKVTLVDSSFTVGGLTGCGDIGTQIANYWKVPNIRTLFVVPLVFTPTIHEAVVPAVAAAGPAQAVKPSTLVTLDGSGSTGPDGFPYAWSQTSGPTVALSSTTVAKPTFTAPADAASLGFKLTVGSGSNTSTSTVTITVKGAPKAAAGPAQTVRSNEQVTLDGSASGPAGVTSAWTQPSGPKVTLSSTTVAKPTFTAPTGPATLGFSLKVSDGATTSAASTVAVTVQAPPVASAGPAQTVPSLAPVSLDGSASTGPTGRTYAWSQTTGPTVTLSSTSIAKPTFTAPLGATSLTFSLTVSDGLNTSPAKTVTVKVDPPIVVLSDAAFVKQQYQDFLGRAPSAAELKAATTALTAGTAKRPDVVADLVTATSFAGPRDAVARVYLAAFGRVPDPAGLAHWVTKKEGGMTLEAIAIEMTRSNEFKTHAGKLTDDAFVAGLYLNVLGRVGNSSGTSYWTGQLAKGMNRGAMVAKFSQTSEAIAKTATRTKVIGLYLGMLRRTPSATELATQVGRLSSGTPLASLIAEILDSAPYRARVTV